MSKNKPSMTTFYIVWFGQLVSMIGSGMTSFALSLWVYRLSGSVTEFALINLFAVLPRIFLAPIAGALVDRWDRRKVMIVSDTLAGLTTLFIAIVFTTETIALWHIYMVAFLNAIFYVFQWPAFLASMTHLVPKKSLGRANGMLQLNRAAAEIFSPILAGALLVTIELTGILIIDFSTFLFAVAALLLIRFPKPASKPLEKITPRRSIWRESLDGLKYIQAREGLLGLALFNAVDFFLWGMVSALITPMILGFVSEDVLGQILSAAGLGLLTGGLIMSAWGGPRRKIYGVLVFELISGVCFIMIGVKPIAWLVALGAFTAHLTIAIVSGSDQSIWQVKVPPELQGRVFSAMQMITRSMMPLSFLLAGLLADNLFEPMLAEGGSLSGGVGQFIGVGAGRGIGLMFLIMGVIKIGVSAWGLLYPRIRLIEDELPDRVE